MTVELTKEEKISIIEQHLKNFAYSEYNVELSLIEENAATSPNTSAIAKLNEQLATITSQKTALQAEINNLNN
jgi:molecular chaperone GrpE (heat shock protein)